MISSQQQRRLSVIEEQLVPPIRYIIYTGVPRPPGTSCADDGYSSIVVRTGPEELEESVEQEGSVVAAEQEPDDEGMFAIDLDAPPEPEVKALEPAAASTPIPIIEPLPAPAPAPPQPGPWQPLVRERAPEPAFRPCRGRYSWMR
jgi:hypothetical protein